MSTSFSCTAAAQPHSSEWDSDVDDSSEEFEYVKGDDDERRANGRCSGESSPDEDDDDDAKDDDNGGESKKPDSLGVIGEDEVWNAHADKIVVGSATNGM